MRILLLARWVQEDARLDAISIPETALDLGHSVNVLSVTDFIGLEPNSHLPIVDIDVIVCRFSSDPLASIAVQSYVQKGIPVVGGYNGVTYGDDQEITLGRLSAASIRVPTYVVIRRIEDIKAAVASIGLPAVTKDPLTMGGSGVRLARSPADIAANFMDCPSRRLVVQHFHAEVDRSDLRLFVVGESVIGAIRRQASNPREFRANRCLGGTYHAYKPTPLEAKIAVEATREMNLDIAGVDILPTADGPVVSEVNHNPAAFGIPGAARAIVELAEYRVQAKRRLRGEGD